MQGLGGMDDGMDEDDDEGMDEGPLLLVDMATPSCEPGPSSSSSASSASAAAAAAAAAAATAAAAVGASGPLPLPVPDGCRAAQAAQAAQAAGAAELQLQRWAQLGEASLSELLYKDAHTEWGFVCTREGIEGFSAMVPLPAAPSCDGLDAAPEGPASSADRLDFCVKSEARS